MADEDDSQKTEEPTARKLAQAREKGQVGSSQEVKSWAVLIGGTLALALFGPWMLTGLAKYCAIFIKQSYAIPVNQAALVGLLVDALLKMGLYSAPMMAVLVFVALVSNVAQTGLLVALDKIKPDAKKISVMAGIKRMFSLRTVVEFIKGLLKLAVLTIVAIFMVMPWFDDLRVMPDMDLAQIVHRVYVVSLTVLSASVIVMTVIAALDFAYQKFDFIKNLRMSHQDIKDEYKDTEGDPKIKARIRQIRAQRAQQRMMDSVPTADVVITNPTHFAVALQYKTDDMQAPRLVAKGVDSLAFRIREVAEANDVPIVENPPLARALYASVELDQEVPVEHYQAVAEVIGYIMKLKGNKSGGNGIPI